MLLINDKSYTSYRKYASLHRNFNTGIQFVAHLNIFLNVVNLIHISGKVFQNDLHVCEPILKIPCLRKRKLLTIMKMEIT